MNGRRVTAALLFGGAGLLAMTSAAPAVGALLGDAPQPAPAMRSAAPRAVRLPPDRNGVPAPAPAAQPASAATTVQLTASQKALAGRLLASSPDVARVTSGGAYRVSSSLPWTAPGSDRVSGAYLTVTLQQRFSGDVTLPGVRYAATGADYTVLRLHQRITSATGLAVLVSFDRRSVVGVDAQAAKITELPGNLTSAARGN